MSHENMSCVLPKRAAKLSWLIRSYTPHPPPAMAGGDVVTDSIQTSLTLVNDVLRISCDGFCGYFKRDCMDLARRISLLVHLLEEIRDLKPNLVPASSSYFVCCLHDLSIAIRAAKNVLLAANKFNSKMSSDGTVMKIQIQFQCVTWKLERSLGNIPYDNFDISEEVQEQVELVRSQLRRATERYGGPLNSNIASQTLSELLDEEIDLLQSGNRVIGCLHIENIGNVDHGTREKVADIPVSLGISGSIMVNGCTSQKLEEKQKPKTLVIPEDFLCPISLEIMRDPVIVATGQTYERSYIQRWIDYGNTTCPKTQQKLEHLTLTPNYVLRSLISQWCAKNNIEQPTASTGGRIKKNDGSFCDVSEDIAAIRLVVSKLSSRCIEECRAAVSEIRSLSKRSTSNRILIGEAGAIPVLMNLMTSEDTQIQENAVTSILNLSIYDNNKEHIMFTGAIPCIVQVLRSGSMEARENAAATLFSLSFGDESKVIIGASGAIPALVQLLQNGSTQGKKDAATALFNLCIHQGNKGRAVRAGIIPELLKMLTDSSSFMVDEALAILSLLANHHEAKVAITKASPIPMLLSLLRTGLPCNKENAAAILVSICKRDAENLACLSRLGAAIPLTELAKNGTERAKRKAASLLERLQNAQQL